jgi:hypothetical protein
MLTHVTDCTAFTPGHWATGIYLSISQGSLLTPLKSADTLVQRNYTTLAGTHLHLGEVKHRR